MKYYLCHMDTQGLLLLAQVVLPGDILTRFIIANVELANNDILIYLDEKADADLLADANIESEGFMNPITVRDFPIRDRGVDLIVRRRRWYNKLTNKSFSVPFQEIKADGTRYSKEFAAFLKDVYGDQAYDLPFA